MQFESLKRGEGECGKHSIKEIITIKLSILKKNFKHKSRMSYKPKAGKYKKKKKKLHKENHTEFLQHKQVRIIEFNVPYE